MKYLKALKEITNKLDKDQLITNINYNYRIINNSRGKNYILLEFPSEEKKIDLVDKKKLALKKMLKEYVEFIEEIETEFDVSEKFKNDIYKICNANQNVHRNKSYISWQRDISITNNLKKNIICGYSYKGGMGRSSMLGYLAYLAYFQGKKVAVLDFDFEAPGITSLFFDKKTRESKGGILDYLLDNEIVKDLNIKDYILPFEVGSNGGNLYGFHSGIDYSTENYLNKISKIDFNSEKYIKKVLNFVETIQENLNIDLIFIDLRAGLSESNGAILKQISNMNLFVFNSEEQNLEGLVVIQNILNDHSYLINSTIRFSDSDLAMQKKDELNLFLKKEKINFKEIFDINYNEFMLNNKLKDFNEFVDSQSELYSNTSEKNIFLKLLYEQIKKSFFKEISPILSENLNVEMILKKLKEEFKKNIASKKFETEEDLKNFYFKEDLKKIVNEQVILILGPKGSGKSTFYEIFTKNFDQIFKHLNIKKNKYIDGFSNKISVIFSSEFISNLDLKNKKIGKRFWKFLNLYNLEREYYQSKENYFFQTEEELSERLKNEDTILEVEKALKKINISLMEKGEVITLVYDELDSKFINYKDIIISSLIEVGYDNIYMLPNIKSKILLRNDIFKDLKIENKTHLSLNSYELKWDEKDLFSLILKIMINSLSDEECSMLGIEFVINGKEGHSYEVTKDEEKIKKAIKLLFGEQPWKAKNVGTSYNWIIKQLSDGKGVITPRTIYKFMHSTIELELEKFKESKNRIFLFEEIGTSPLYKIILSKVSEDKYIEFDEEYDLKKEYELIKKIGYQKFSFEDYKGTFPKKTKMETIKKNLEELIGSGYLLLRTPISKVNPSYRIAEIYSHSLDMKKNKKRGG